MSIDKLREELRNYYFEHSYAKLDGASYKNPFWDIMDEYAAAHSGLSAVRLKAAQYEIIAENFRPVIFKNSPFYSEMGVKVAESNGIPWFSAGGWLFKRNAHLFCDANPDEYAQYWEADRKGIHLAYGPYVDIDHHCFPYSNVMQNGLGHIYLQAEAALKHCANKDQT